MKNTSLTIISFFLCFSVFAQEAKPCLFIGTFEINKRGICGDYELVHEQVMDYADFVIKRIKFIEEHKAQSPSTKFVDKNESVIAYKYEKKISGWGCNSNVISTKIGKTIEECNKQLADQLAKSPKDFTTQPNIFFTWQGKGNSMAVYTKDFGGLNGAFTSGNTASKNFILAKLANKTSDKTAYILLKTDNGTKTVEYINPGATLTKSYETKNLDIKVIYLDSKKPKPSVDIIKSIKEYVRGKVTNEKGVIKIEKMGQMGVRG
jgi:hypothetical protein